MARVVCQVQARSNRLTLIWSDGAASFPPYTLEEAAVAELQRLANQAHQQLAILGAAASDAAATARAGHLLAQVGHFLHRLVFQLDGQGSQAGRQVSSWLEGLTRDGAVERLEILGDTFSVPWTLLYGQAPDQAAFVNEGLDGPCWRSFWGRLYGLAGGSRVPCLRDRTWPDKPIVVMAVDAVTRASLPQDEQFRLNQFLEGREVHLAESSAALTEVLLKHDVDLLYVCGRVDGQGMRLGNDRLTAETLEAALQGRVAEQGPTTPPLVFLNGCPGNAPGNLLAAFERFGGYGLMGAVQPLAAPLANRCGLDLLTQVLDAGLAPADALLAIRKSHPSAGLFYFGTYPAEAPEPAAGDLALPEKPYQPLAPLGMDEAALLVGREADTAELASLLDDGAVRLVLVHGPAGIGKASLLHAGLVPYLETQSVGYQFLRQRNEEEPAGPERDCPILPIRATSDLSGQLAIALLDFCSRPYLYVTPTGETATVDLPGLLCQSVLEHPSSDGLLPSDEDMRLALRDNAGLLGRVLAAITAPLPYELVLLVEHGEELFSLNDPGAESDEAYLELEMLRTALAGPARVKFIVSLQTEFVGRVLEPLLQTTADRGAVRTFLVPELTDDDLLEIVLQPTSQEPLPGTEVAPLEYYGFQFEQGLPEQIATEARRLGEANQEYPLALVHVVCSQLHQLVSRQGEKVIRAAHLKEIGGVDHGLAKYVARLIQGKMPGTAGKALSKILQRLVQRQPDGLLTSDLVFAGELASEWKSSESFEKTVSRAADESMGLLQVNYLNVDGMRGDFVSLGHNALAPVFVHRADETAKKTNVWAGAVGVLWVTIPLLILAAVFIWTRYRHIWVMEENLEAQGQALEKSHARIKAMRWPTYMSHIRAAQESIQVGDMIRAEQALIAVKPLAEDEADLRGFEWYALWQRLHQDQLTVFGHRGTVTGVGLTPDGLTLGSVCEGGQVRIWNVVARKERAALELKGNNAVVPGRCLSFSPDGSLLAVGGDDGGIRLWKVGPAGLDYPHNAAGLVAIMPINAWPARLVPLALRGQANSIVPLDSLTDHKGAVLALAFKPDGKTLASAGKDGRITLWDLTATPAKVTATLTEHGSVLAAAYSPDGAWLASAGADKKVVIWDTKDNSKKATLEGHPGDVAAVAWSADGKMLASGGTQITQLLETGFIRLWDTATWKERSGPSLPTAAVFALAFVEDDKTLAIASQRKSLQFLDIGTGQPRPALHGHVGWVRSLAVARGGAVMATGSYDCTGRVWIPKVTQSRDLLQVSTEPVRAVVFSPDDRWLATGSGDGMVKIWDTATGAEIKAIKAHQGAVMALAWGYDGTNLVSGGADGQLKLWDAVPASAAFGTELDSAQAHTQDVTCLSWSLSDPRFASGGVDGTIKLWQVANGKFAKEPLTIKAENAVYSLYYLQALNILASGHDDGKIRHWNPSTGKASSDPVLAGHTGRVTGIAITLKQDQRQFVVDQYVTGSVDQTVKLWRAGADKYTLRGHTGMVTCLALTIRLDRNLVSGGSDGVVKLWDPHMEEERMTLRSHGAPVRAVAIGGNSLVIASACQDGTVRIYRGDAEDSKRK